MKTSEIMKHIDHTNLKADATEADIIQLCEEAALHGMASVCVPPMWVKTVAQILEPFETRVCTVVGFPYGFSTPYVKGEEAQQAVLQGADEIDMVINIAKAKERDFKYIEDEVRYVKQRMLGNQILKVIIETHYFYDEAHLYAIASACIEGGADFLKTSTGTVLGGAQLNHIKVFSSAIIDSGKSVQIKASGGVRTREAMIQFIEAGCSRIGTSSAMSLIDNREMEGY